MNTIDALKTMRTATGRSVSVFAADVGRGMLELAHNTLALVGFTVVAAMIFAVGQSDLRQQAESVALDWLQTRHTARAIASGDLLSLLNDNDAVSRATAADLKELPKDQASVATWISRRYRVAPEPVARLVQEAWEIGQQAKLDPTLILAIIAIESSFNPFAQSTVGAQGLMQVMTRIHDEKYQAFGGAHAAFDPLTNLRVGVQVLKECIQRAGSLEAGLRYYVGAALLESDGGYAAKVMYEQSNMRRVADGRAVAVNVSSTPPAPAADLVPVSAPSASSPSARGQQVALLR